MHVDVSFPGGLAVDAHLRGFVIPTDQPVKAGGEGEAPTPVDLFVASLATCAGFYALRFCRERSIDPEGLALSMDGEKDAATGLLSRLRIELTLPPDFPERYREAIGRAVDHCTVKRHLQNPPAFEVAVVVSAMSEA